MLSKCKYHYLNIIYLRIEKSKKKSKDYINIDKIVQILIKYY